MTRSNKPATQPKPAPTPPATIKDHDKLAAGAERILKGGKK